MLQEVLHEVGIGFVDVRVVLRTVVDQSEYTRGLIGDEKVSPE